MSLRTEHIRKSMVDYNSILEIYKNSFPKVEQFPVWLLRIMLHLKGINSVAFYDRNNLCGFSYFLVNENTVFILFLAVNDKIRSKGYGSQSGKPEDVIHERYRKVGLTGNCGLAFVLQKCDRKWICDLAGIRYNRN